MNLDRIFLNINEIEVFHTKIFKYLPKLKEDFLSGNFCNQETQFEFNENANVRIEY